MAQEEKVTVLCLRGVTGLWIGKGEEDTMGGVAPVLSDQLTVVWLVSAEEGCTPPTALKSVTQCNKASLSPRPRTDAVTTTK